MEPLIRTKKSVLVQVIGSTLLLKSERMRALTRPFVMQDRKKTDREAAHCIATQPSLLVAFRGAADWMQPNELHVKSVITQGDEGSGDPVRPA